MRRRFFVALAFGSMLLTGASGTPALAGDSYEFLFSASHVSNDTQLFLNLAVGNAGYSRAVIEPIVPRCRVVEYDLPVILLLARESHKSPEAIMRLRADGLSWSIIFRRVGVPMDVLFVGIPRDPGPPYGHAWGYWRKHGRRTKLADDDVVALSRLQIGHRVTGVSAYEIARSCGNGRNVVTVVADKKGRKAKGNDQGNQGQDDHQGNQGKKHGKGGRHGD